MLNSGATTRKADVCLILEGTYPYVTGGVSTWTHDLISAQSDLSFHLVTLFAPSTEQLVLRYQIPKNVISLSNVFIQRIRPGAEPTNRWARFVEQLEGPLTKLQTGGGLDDLTRLIQLIQPVRQELGAQILMNSPAAWDLLVRMYDRDFAHASFIDYFWSWRSILGGLYSILFADIPSARVYHSVSTGYAGLLAARASVETGRPSILTEHGIYTN